MGEYLKLSKENMKLPKEYNSLYDIDKSIFDLSMIENIEKFYIIEYRNNIYLIDLLTNNWYKFNLLRIEFNQIYNKFIIQDLDEAFKYLINHLRKNKLDKILND